MSNFDIEKFFLNINEKYGTMGAGSVIVRDGKVELGIAICGTGIGISIAANKVKGVRCARITNIKDAKETRIHNNANVIALSGKLFFFEAKDIVDVFLKTQYVPEERFERRINKLTKYEDK